MSLFDAFSYEGKRALVVGGATGMGAATAEVVRDGGADVVVMDRAPVEIDGVEAITLDLSDRESIEAAAEACGGPVHALFSCAGVADGPGIERINFLGHRHLIDRLRTAGHLPRGSAIAMISSSAGLGWETNLDLILDFLAIEDFDEAARWCVDNERAHYMWTKQVINAYVAQQAMPLLAEGIRINATLPGPTNTPLARANAETWLTFGEDYRELTGTEASTPLEQAYPLAFLCSDAAAGISGITL
ncbi:MAG: SDR family oxidoreductase, partial [Actinomycetota bacterium]